MSQSSLLRLVTRKVLTQTLVCQQTGHRNRARNVSGWFTHKNVHQTTWKYQENEGKNNKKYEKSKWWEIVGSTILAGTALAANIKNITGIHGLLAEEECENSPKEAVIFPEEEEDKISPENLQCISPDTWLNVPTEDENSACVICLGTTGTGKSTTINIMTGQNIERGGGAESITRQTAIYEGDKWEFIDTPGLQDGDPQMEDGETYRQILQFMNLNKKLSVQSIIWCITPQIRCTDFLLQQARLIKMFEDNSREGPRVWSKVVVICKHPPSSVYEGQEGLTDDCQGALEAAGQAGACPGEVKVVGHTIRESENVKKYLDFLEQEHKTKRHVRSTEAELPSGLHIPAHHARCGLGEKFSEDCDQCQVNYRQYKAITRLKENREIKEELEALVAEGSPLQVIFQDTECKDCGEKGDSRLMSDYCHGKMRNVHSEEILRHHLSNPVNYHRHPILATYHKGTNENQGYASWLTLHKRFTWDCCPQRLWETEEIGKGCKRKWTCCNQECASGTENCLTTNPYFPCCQSLSHPEQSHQKQHPQPASYNFSKPWTALYKSRVHPCCQQMEGSPGCSTYYTCCQKFEQDPSFTEEGCQVFSKENFERVGGCCAVWSCCGGFPEEKGCQEVCERCGSGRGTSAVGPCLTVHSSHNSSTFQV